ncbi:hypothetical protein AA11825_0455 [Acetobacter pomorum DSM 11825]|nr:hypothetical protein AA11825_0455 [Acetobacter pomorum DSM 11825]
MRTSLKEIESQQYGGLSREHVWEWFCAKHGVTVTKATFVNLLYRARKRAKKEQIKKAQLAGLSVQPAQSVAPEPAILTTPMKKPKKHVERAADKPEVSHENVLPENPTGLQRLRAALNVKTPVLDWEEDDRFAKYRNGK